MFEHLVNPMVSKAAAQATKAAKAAKMTPAVQSPSRGGIAGIIRTLGDNAAQHLYGADAHRLRRNVWSDILGGLAESFGGGDVMGPGRQRAMEERSRVDMLKEQAVQRWKAEQEQRRRKALEAQTYIQTMPPKKDAGYFVGD